MDRTAVGRGDMTALEEHNCGHCGRPVIGGWSGTGQLLSVQITVDAQPIPSPEAELWWLVAGCRTWTLHTVARQLHPRDHRKIRQWPAGITPRRTVHPVHRCTPGEPT